MASPSTAKPATAAAVNRLQEDRHSGAITSGNNANLLARQRLDLFGARCHELIERINFGAISFIDGVDLAYSAALWSGLEAAAKRRRGAVS
jgi:hypothetical protein